MCISVSENAFLPVYVCVCMFVYVCLDQRIRVPVYIRGCMCL